MRLGRGRRDDIFLTDGLDGGRVDAFASPVSSQSKAGIEMAEKSWALVTGASAGIGLELARVFAENGWSIVLVARRKVRLEELSRELMSAHGTETRKSSRPILQTPIPHKPFSTS